MPPGSWLETRNKWEASMDLKFGVFRARVRPMLAIAAVALATLGSAGTARAATPVGFQFDGLAFYQFGAPTDLVPGAPGGCPDTGFVRITNNGASTFNGTIGFNAVSGGGANDSAAYAVTLNPGDHSSFSFQCESSNQGGFNGPTMTTQNGAQLFMFGTVSVGASSESVNFAIYDKDIHSGSFRTNPFGVVLDNYILQGGDPLGRDTADAYETTQAPGPFQFVEVAPPAEQPITASGTTLAAVEGTVLSGSVATFTDPSTSATPSEYSASIDWGDGSTPDAGVVTASSGLFSVSGTHAYAEEGSFPVTVTITDLDTTTNGATANSTANVGDAALALTCASSSTSPTSFNGNVASVTDANSNATAADFTATISWGDGSTSKGSVSGSTGGPFTVSGSHNYSATGPESIFV